MKSKYVTFYFIFGFIIFVSAALIIIFPKSFCLGDSVEFLQLYLFILGLELIIETFYSLILLVLYQLMLKRSKEMKQSQEIIRVKNQEKTQSADSPGKTQITNENCVADIVMDEYDDNSELMASDKKIEEIFK